MDPEIIVPDSARPPVQRAAVPYGVPRRFGVGTILVVTAAFAVLLAVLRWLGAAPMAIGFLVLFVTLVGLGQAILYRGRRPRRASIVTGVAFYAVFFAVQWMRDSIGVRGPGFAARVDWLGYAIVWTIPLGTACGYLAGCFVAAVFLLMDAVDRLIGRWRTKPVPKGAGDAP